MQHKYLATYQDSLGKEDTICYSDGYDLEISIRGVKFDSSSFNMMVIESEENCHLFDTNKNRELKGVFNIKIPLYIYDENNVQTKALLDLTFDYRLNNNISFLLTYKENTYDSDRIYDDVENILMSVQKLLPDNCKLKCCMACRYSTYHPVGNNDFGTLICLKKVNVEELDKIVDKRDIMFLFERAHQENKTDTVQETFLCARFKEQTQKTCLYKSF